MTQSSEHDARPGRWARWVRFLDQREPGTSLALFRIAIGLVVVGAIGSIVLHDLVPVLWFDRAHGGFLPALEENWLFQILGGATPTTVWAMTAIALVSGALLAVGFRGRLSAFVTLQSYLALTNLNPLCHGGDDILLGNALWLLVLARSNATLALDCRLRTGRWSSDEAVPAWPRYLAIYQLVLVYWATGCQKVSVDWIPGGELSALYYILQQPSWHRWDMSWLAWIYPLTQVATLGAWLFEVSALVLLLALWYRSTPERPGCARTFFNWINYRRLFVIVGATMHAALILSMNVEPFSWATLSFYVCLFRPEEWQAWRQRLFGFAPAMLAPSSPGMKWWPSVRAVLVTLHLAAISLLGFPAPPEMAVRRHNWQDAAVQSEIQAWSARLTSWGLGVSPLELEDGLFTITKEYLGVRNALLQPFQPYYTYCGTYQSWQMFCAADRIPARLHVDIEETGTWRTVLVERDAQYPWLDNWLSHHRMRPAVYAFGEGDKDYPLFAEWLAGQAALDFPRAERVRVRYYKCLTPSPEEARAGLRHEGWFMREEVIVLQSPPG